MGEEIIKQGRVGDSSMEEEITNQGRGGRLALKKLVIVWGNLFHELLKILTIMTRFGGAHRSWWQTWR
jgi:hypothetical protein